MQKVRSSEVPHTDVASRKEMALWAIMWSPGDGMQFRPVKCLSRVGGHRVWSYLGFLVSG